MSNSKSIAGIVGPTLIIMVTSELKLWNPTLYDGQIVPLVYLSGVLFFVAGISIVLAHNVWVKGWPVILTLVGWFGMLLGAARMFFPQAYIGNFKNDGSIFAIELILISIGILLTIKAYWPQKR